MTNIEKARVYGKAWAEGMFRDFKDHPEYQGSNFTWERFPVIASRLAKSSCFINFRRGVKHLPDLKKACKNACMKRAKELIKYGN